jgi:membrane-associated protease RseP (regulator of RpoE activity)
MGTFKAKDSFIMASFRAKTIILFAGVTVNFLFAWFVFTMLFWR